MSGRKLQAFEKSIINTSNVLNTIGMVLLFVLMMQGAVDVIGRYLFNKPIIGTMERGQVILALMVFFAWGSTQIARAHVNVELFFRRFPRRAQAIISFATTFLVLVFFVLIAWQAVMSAKLYHEGGRLIYVIHWPLAPFQFAVTLGALVLCLVLIMEMIQRFLQMKRGD